MATKDRVRLTQTSAHRVLTYNEGVYDIDRKGVRAPSADLVVFINKLSFLILTCVPVLSRALSLFLSLPFVSVNFCFSL